MLNINNLSASYGENNVLSNISFSVGENQALSILGSNGCGKTTLLKCIASLIDYQGEILLDNANIKEMKKNELALKVGVLGQLSQTYYPYSVYDTVMMGRYSQIKYRNKHGKSKSIFSLLDVTIPNKQDKEYVNKCLEMTDLIDIKNKNINTLSGGQLQRVFLARTFAQEPEIILLDEPSNHLDLKHQTQLISYLKEWIKEGNHSVIGVFHDINLALTLSENVMFINNKKIISQGDFNKITTKTMLKDIYNMDVVGYMQQSLKRWEHF